MPDHLSTLLDGRPLAVMCRPHYRLEGEELFFLASSRPHCRLTQAELAIWAAIQSPVRLDTLRARFPGVADDVVRSFLGREICELLETSFPAARRRVLVIEPHADDAALSVAGTMWARRHECEFTIATLASRSNYTSYYNLERDYFNVDRVTQLRRDESELFARMLGGHHIDVGRTDAAVRYRDGAEWSLDYFRRNRMVIAAATARTADAQERARWIGNVRALLAGNPWDEVWIPLGAPHADHVLTTNACLAAIIADRSLIAGCVVKVYQDVPYAARAPLFTGEMITTLAQAGLKVEAQAVPIAEVFEQKLRLVSLYASQFKIGAMRGDIEASALAHRLEAGLAELFWTVLELPGHIDPMGLFPTSTDKQTQESAAEAWLTRNAGAQRVRVLLLVPAGRWASDLEHLREALPAARFEVFAAPAAAAEVSETACDVVDLRPVGGGAAAWAALAVRLAAARPAPTLFHVGDLRLREARWLSRLWPLSDTLVVASMNRVMRAMERQHPLPAGTR